MERGADLGGPARTMDNVEQMRRRQREVRGAWDGPTLTTSDGSTLSTRGGRTWEPLRSVTPVFAQAAQYG